MGEEKEVKMVVLFNKTPKDGGQTIKLFVDETKGKTVRIAPQSSASVAESVAEEMIRRYPGILMDAGKIRTSAKDREENEALRKQLEELRAENEKLRGASEVVQGDDSSGVPTEAEDGQPKRRGRPPKGS